MKNRNIILTTILLALGSFAVPWSTRAVSPAPDGGYPGGNTAEGQNALFSLTTGGFNTAVGFLSLRSNTTGQLNTAIGAGTLLANTADGNTATGAGALLSNTTGGDNTADGAFALFSNVSGRNNTATGQNALTRNTTGQSNTANGVRALEINIDGDSNTANGAAALAGNIGGSNNTASGTSALFNNSTGSNNTAIGVGALQGNAGDGNIALGYNAGSNLTSGSNNIYLGSLGVATEDNTIRIGTAGTQNRAFIRGIRGVTTGNNDAIAVVIDTAGQLGTTSSSRRFKKEIKPMDNASDAILALKPVTFHYNSDKTNTPQFGLIAEEVAEVNPNLVVRDENGEIYTVRYDAVNAMLLNEFLKEHRKVEEQQATITELKSTVAKQEKAFETTIAQFAARLKEQESKIQQVSAEVEMNKGSSHVVATNR